MEDKVGEEYQQLQNNNYQEYDQSAYEKMDIPSQEADYLQRSDYFSQDDNAHEIYKISPKFKYRYEHQDHYYNPNHGKYAPNVISEEIITTSTPQHLTAAAGISILALIILLLFICGLIPLVCYMCRPEFENFRTFSICKWFKEHLTPMHAKRQKLDFEKDYYATSKNKKKSMEVEHSEPPPILPTQSTPEPHDLSKHENNSKKSVVKPNNLDERLPRRTLHIQLKETPLEMSISEVEEETEHVSDASDFGRKHSTGSYKDRKSKRKLEVKPRSKSVPTTPMSPFDKIKKRFAFNNTNESNEVRKNSKPDNIFSASSHTTTTGEDDENVIYNRYTDESILDITKSRSIQRTISNGKTNKNIHHRNSKNQHVEVDEDDEELQQKYEENSRKQPLSSFNRDDETDSSSTSSITNDKNIRRNDNVMRKSSTEDFYQNKMVNWK